MASEVFLSGNWHTAEYALADRPPQSHWGDRGDGWGVDSWLRRFAGRAGHEEDTNEDNVRHPLRDRSVPARRVQEVRRKLGPYYSSMRRTPHRVFSSP